MPTRTPLPWRAELRGWLIWALLAKGAGLTALWWFCFRGGAG